MEKGKKGEEAWLEESENKEAQGKLEQRVCDGQERRETKKTELGVKLD
jgi:hypothetical protein